MSKQLVRWASLLAIFIALGVAGALAYAGLNNRLVSVNFSRIAALDYETAMREIRRHRGATFWAVFDNKPVIGLAVGVARGEGFADDLFRVMNLGPGPGAVYFAVADDDDACFVLGKFRLFEKVGTRWREKGIVENQQFRWSAPQRS